MKLTIRMFRPICKVLRIMASHLLREHNHVALGVCDVAHAPNAFARLRIAQAGYFQTHPSARVGVFCWLNPVKYGFSAE
jgi:hypothetical protein